MRGFIYFALYNLFMLYALLIIFAISAYYDIKYKKLLDIVTASGWLLLILFASDKVLEYSAISFGVLFFINALAAFGKAPLISWGDILLIPLYVGYVTVFAKTPGSFTLFLLLPLSFLFIFVTLSGRKKDIPLAPFIFLPALILLAA